MRWLLGALVGTLALALVTVSAVPAFASTTVAFASSDGTYTVTTAGTDIYGNADSFVYAYAPASGDGTWSFRLDGVQNAVDYTKVGLMVRASLSADSPMILMMNMNQNGNWLVDRTTAGGSVNTVAGGLGVAPPVWFKIEKTGTTFSVLDSADGVTWSAVGSPVTLDVGNSYYVGIAATEHDPTVVGSATVSNVVGFTPIDGQGIGVSGVESVPATTPSPSLNAAEILAQQREVRAQVLTASRYLPVPAPNSALQAEIVLAELEASQAQVGNGLRGSAIGREIASIQALYPSLSGTLPQGLSVKAVTPGGAPVLIASDGDGTAGSPLNISALWTAADQGNVAAALELTGLGLTMGLWQNTIDASLPTTAAAKASSSSRSAFVASNGTYTVTAAGTDIYGSADSFVYAYAPASGDGTWSMELNGVQNPVAWTKVGLMIRSSLSADSPMLLLMNGYQNGNWLVERTTAGGSVNTVAGGLGVAPPVWFKIEKTGATFSVFDSVDGSSWNAVGSPVTLDIGSNYYVGIAASEHDPTAVGSATVSNIVGFTPTDGQGIGVSGVQAVPAPPGG